MEVTERARLQIGDATTVGVARRRSVEIARSLGLGELDVARLALVVTEAATNLVKHAGGGEIFLRALQRGGDVGVDLVAIDRGPGIRCVGEALRDGFSTSGTPGTGLGAIARSASYFDLYSHAGGAALLAQIWPAGRGDSKQPLEIGSLNVAHPAERVSGDAWSARQSPDGALVLVADGLGHGVQAAEASRAAVDAFGKRFRASAAETLEEIHRALRPTRGAAVAVAGLDRTRGLIGFAGIGNIAGAIVSGGQRRSLVSHHGIAGISARRIQEFSYPWTAGDLLVLHSDGLGSHWSLDAYPGVALRHPTLAAALLYRDHSRGSDDTTVVVLRENP
jgi:anti-sigma regulatory factor (Ser/Thr protein kinase)